MRMYIPITIAVIMFFGGIAYMRRNEQRTKQIELCIKHNISLRECQ